MQMDDSSAVDILTGGDMGSYIADASDPSGNTTYQDSGTTAADSGDGGLSVSGLGDIFQTVSSSIASVYRTVNPPPVQTINGVPYVRNAQGQLVPAIAGQQVQQPLNANFLLIVVAVVLIAMFAKK